MPGTRDETRLALIPFSYPRLSEQLGYGAGNRAPWYYQQVWRLRGRLPRRPPGGPVALAARLRAAGQSASLAQASTPTAWPRPGRDARQAGPGGGRGAGGRRRLLRPGPRRLRRGGDARGPDRRRRRAGHPRVGRTPLQEEFYATAQRLRLPLQDAPRQILVHLPGRRRRPSSVFLHRLALAGCPFARELESGLGGRRPGAAGPGRSHCEQLGRVREKWELQWSPATDARLIERNAWGSTLAEVCARLLAPRAGRRRADRRGHRPSCCGWPSATCLDGLPGALARCEALAADSASFPALARATYHLDGLLAYGAARRLPAARLGALAGRLFARAALHLPAAAVCGDEAADEVEDACTPWHDWCDGGSPAAGEPPRPSGAPSRRSAARPASHPALRGLALVLLELGGRLEPGDLARPAALLALPRRQTPPATPA